MVDCIYEYKKFFFKYIFTAGAKMYNYKINIYSKNLNTF